MNLDIMSLMAASAAVSDTAAPKGEGTNALANLAPAAEGNESFADILQMLGSSLENASDMNPASPTAVTMTGGDITGAAIAGETALTEEALTLVAADTQTGGLLPKSGNPLPVAASPDASSNATLAAQSPPSTLLNATLNQVEPTGLTTIPATSAVDATARAATADGSTSLQTAGWFSQRSTTTGMSANTATDVASPESKVNSLRGADLRVDPNTPTVPERAAPGLSTTPVLEAKPAVLASQMQALAAQSAGFGQLASTIESMGLESPRNTIGAPLAATTASGSANTVAFPAPLSTALNLNQAGWDKALGQRLVFMAANGLESAELRLDPPQLGTVHVKLSLQSDQAQVMLQAANPLARDAMETALPRLREMLGSEGVQLESAQVTDRDDANRQRQTGDQHDARGEGIDEEGRDAPTSDAPANSVETLTAASGVISERV